MARLWLKLIKGHKTVRQATVDCAWDRVDEVLTELCREMDLPHPVWLNKHTREMNDFRRTVFSRGDFMEDVAFDRLEIEFLEDLEKPRRSTDPRNAF